MNLIKYLLIGILFLISERGLSQSEHLTIEVDPKVNQLIEKRIQLNTHKPAISGYRVQIYFGSVRSEATDVKTKFNIMYPNTDCYVIYQQPYFKVRAGDFRTKLEATKLKNLINKEFNSVFIVEEDINLPKLNQ